ncbi:MULTISPECIES: substrate-binding domain-containing protein [Haloferax]|uniref:Molybdenum transporter n=1 Tax=Haloferax marinum TaxID=2666143 RepID=A0A6A8G4I2_9EURY|nr:MULTISPECIES: substrate-binding domain-containing protein [Haloferax]KAB1196481.1 molybdenum transporter [Haloferax sp. CBA1150]MRW95478.1 molybdenum transporter [Haloferax marinum]
MLRRQYLRAIGAASAIGVAGCLGGNARRQDGGATLGSTSGDAAAESGTANGGKSADLTLATATTAYDTGLLDVLHEGFADKYGVRVKTLVQGTGAALRTAADGDADVVITHARSAEDEFIRAGHGINRRDLMHNDFLVVGPEDDPAGLETVGNDPRAAFEAIAATESLFISRGDESGTHIREKLLWEQCDANPSGRWYQATGDGMGDTLRQTSRRSAYTLVDRGTYYVMSNSTSLRSFVEGPLGGGPDVLRNDYAVIPTNPAKHDVNYALAMAYVGYLTGREGQELIRNFGETTLFVPDALDDEPPFDQYRPKSGDE